MKLKKLMVAGLVATMVMGSSVVAFAEEPANTGNTTGTGVVEGVVNKDVFSFVLPTINGGTSPLTFTLDPQGLIAESMANNAGKADYTGKTFETDATLFFANDKSAGAADDYSSKSDKLKITNKGTVKADVTLKASVSDNDGISLSSDKTFADDTTASMYLAVIDTADNTAGVPITDNGAVVAATLDAVDASNYEVKYDTADNAYKYELKAGVQDTEFKTYEFQLEGACNANGDWSDLTAATPKVDLVWSIEEHSDAKAPSIATKSYTLTKDTELAVNVNLGAGDLAATKVVSVKNGSSALPSDSWSYNSGVLTFTAARVNTLVNAKVKRTYTIVFDDAAGTTVDIELDGTAE